MTEDCDHQTREESSLIDLPDKREDNSKPFLQENLKGTNVINLPTLGKNGLHIEFIKNSAQNGDEKVKRVKFSPSSKEQEVMKVMPNMFAAARILTTAKEEDEKKIKKEERRKREIKSVLLNLLSTEKTKEPQNIYLIFCDIVGEIADNLLQKSELKKADIIREIKTNQSLNIEGNVEGFDWDRDFIKNKTKEFEHLAKLLRTKKPSSIKSYLEYFILSHMEDSVLDLPQIWREKLRSENPSKSLEETAERADEYAEAFFTFDEKDADQFFNLKTPSPEHRLKFALHPSVVNCKDLDKLTEIFREIEPIDSKSFHLFRSVLVKTTLMHLAETIYSQVDFDHIRAISQHIMDKLKRYGIQQSDGKIVLNPGPNQVVIERIEVPIEKSAISIGRKYIDKDMTNFGDICDMVRFKIFLTEEDSKDIRHMEEATKKILGILFSVFGTDIHTKRVSYAFKSGKTNQNSAGIHHAFHITLNYRYQTKMNGRKNECTNVRTIPLEIHIKKHIDPDVEKEDHKKYSKVKDARMIKQLGLNVSFTEFITDLMDAYLAEDNKNLFNGYDSVEDDSHFVSLHSCAKLKPFREQIGGFIYRLLKSEDAKESLVNIDAIKEILKHETQRKKLERVLKRLQTVDKKEDKDQSVRYPLPPKLIKLLTASRAKKAAEIDADLEKTAQKAAKE